MINQQNNEYIETEIFMNYLKIIVKNNIVTINDLQQIIMSSVNKVAIILKDIFNNVEIQQFELLFQNKKVQHIFIIGNGNIKDIKYITKLSDVDDFIKEEFKNNQFGYELTKKGIPIKLEMFLTFFYNNVQYEGIFRKCAINSDVQNLYIQIENNQINNLMQYDPHLVACTFKQYLQGLNLITIDQVSTINLLESINRMSQTKARILYVMISFLLYVAQYEEQNKMNIKSLAMLLAPTLVKVPDGANPLVGFSTSIAFTQKLLENFQSIAPDFQWDFFLNDDCIHDSKNS